MFEKINRWSVECASLLPGCGAAAGDAAGDCVDRGPTDHGLGHRRMAFVTGMKDHGAAGPVGLIAAGEAGWGRITVRPSGTGAPGVKQGGQAGVVRWAESPR